jgi:hypothetical protein
VSACFLKSFSKRKNPNFVKQSRVWFNDVASLTWKIEPSEREEKLLDSRSTKIFAYNASCDELFQTVSLTFTEEGRCSKLSLDLIKQSQKATAGRNINTSSSNKVNFQNGVPWAASFPNRMTTATSPHVLLLKATAVPSTTLKTHFLPKGIRYRPSAATRRYATQYEVASVECWKLYKDMLLW